jgi:ABC-type transport system involved in multi-copper enzyme maturation permease subunit
MLRSKFKVVFGRVASGWLVLISVLALTAVGLLSSGAGNATELGRSAIQILHTVITACYWTGISRKSSSTQRSSSAFTTL